jgi:2-dehydro-3-deoxy-D-arabinonate dehydratase
MRRIVRTTSGWGVLHESGDVEALAHPLRDILAGAPVWPTGEVLLPGPLLAPVDDQEVWASGVTYERSLVARTQESQEPDVYERVYEAERPELFFKAAGWRVRGPGDVGCIRSDSTWDVPEPEVALVIAANGDIFGYTIGDDLSSRSIEGDNPLYLPQAKVYTGSCVLGPCIVPASDVDGPFDVRLSIDRAGETIFDGTTSTAKMRRTFRDLATWLTRAVDLPQGAVLLTGTGLVPDEPFTLMADDTIHITVDPIGTLTHTVGVLDCQFSRVAN